MRDTNVLHDPFALSCDGVSNFSGNFYYSNIHRNTNVAATEEDIAVVEENIAAVEGRMSSVESRVTGIEQYLGGDNFIVDDSIAYAKVVPKNACEKAKILSVGGMSYKSENLIPFPYTDTTGAGYTETKNGVTFAVLADGGISINGLCEKASSFTIARGINYFSEPIYIGTNKPSSVTKEGLCLSFNSTIPTADISIFYENSVNPWLYVYVNAGVTYNGVIYPMLNYGTTAMPYKPYFAGLRHTKVTEMKSEGANLIPFPYTDTTGAGYTETKNGVTFAVLADGGISINGLCEKASSFTIARGINYFSEPIYIGTNKPSSVTKEGLCLSFNSTIPTADISIFYENSVNPWLYVYVNAGVTYNGVIYPMLNYGATAAPYKPYRVDNPIGTLAIPEAVQALDGYGVGVDADHYNHLKVVGNKVFYHKVCEKVVLDGVREKINEVTQSAIGLYRASAIMPRIAATPHHFIISHFIAQNKKALGYSWITGSPVTALIMYNTDQSLTTVDAWNAWLAEQSAAGNPVTAVYALANPTVTDVTEHFTAMPFIEVEGDGALTAVNEYKQAAPSSVKYLVTYPKEV